MRSSSGGNKKGERRDHIIANSRRTCACQNALLVADGRHIRPNKEDADEPGMPRHDEHPIPHPGFVPAWARREDGPVIAELLTALCLCGGATGPYEPADRGPVTSMGVPPPVAVPVWPTGIWGRPFAPFGLDDCEEMRYYADQFGLPPAFDRIGWRESNCRNEDGVRTFCCYGYWQLNEMHFTNHPEIFGEICDAWSHADVDSDTALDKQRQACSAKQLYDTAGLGPWRSTA